MAENAKSPRGAADEVSHKVFTVANVISLIRLLMVPLYLALLLQGLNLADRKSVV